MDCIIFGVIAMSGFGTLTSDRLQKSRGDFCQSYKYDKQTFQPRLLAKVKKNFFGRSSLAFIRSRLNYCNAPMLSGSP